MRTLQPICLAVLLVPGPTGLARAQEPPPAPSQSHSAPRAEEKQRTAKETKKELEDLACGPSNVHLLHHTVDGPLTPPEPRPDKGLIYVIRTKNIVGSGEQANFAMDGRWVGANRIGNYFYLQADPGPHYFCLKYWGAHPGLLSLMIEKGKAYYLREIITLGNSAEIDLLDEKEGKQYVAEYRRSTFEVKRKK